MIPWKVAERFCYASDSFQNWAFIAKLPLSFSFVREIMTKINGGNSSFLPFITKLSNGVKFIFESFLILQFPWEITYFVCNPYEYLVVTF